MVWFKSCPKCDNGDIMFEQDRDGCRVKCVQCGYSQDTDSQYQATKMLAESLSRRFLLSSVAV